MPAYAMGGTGWSSAYARMLIDHGHAASLEDVFPPIDAALLQLAEVPPANLWQGVRRLQAIATLTRVSPEHAPGGGQADLVQRTLHDLAAPDADGEGLHAALADPTLTLPTWHEGLVTLVDEGILTMEYRSMSTAPCSSELIGVEIEGDVDPVTVLTTHFCRPDLTVEDLDMLLDAEHWPECPGFWCEMNEELPPPDVDVRSFVEVVASDCAGACKITTRLHFARRTFADHSASLDYWLPLNQADPADGLVVVDEGSILVEPSDPSGGPGVCVSTTKRIRFVDPLSGAQLALTACALGWDGAGEQFVWGCQPPPPVDDPVE
jgi:hypothetical protein